MKKLNKQRMRTASLFMVTILAGTVVLTAQPARTQLVQHEMINNMTMMLLNNNPMLPDSSVTFDCNTNERIAKIVYLKFDDMYATEFETFLYNDEPARSKEEVKYGKNYPTYCGTLGYDRILEWKTSFWLSGEEYISTTTYTYDSEGLLTGRDNITYYHDTVIFETHEDAKSEANAQNQIISESLTSDSPVYQTFIYEYYDENGKVKSESVETGIYGGTSNMRITTYIYNEKDWSVERLIYADDFQEPWTKYIDSYDSYGRPFRSDKYEGTDPESLTCTEYTLTYYSGVGITDLAQGETMINVYPNPTTGELTIYEDANLAVEVVKIYDLLGKEVLGCKLSDGKVNVSQLSPGTYILRIGSYAVKFVKE